MLPFISLLFFAPIIYGFFREAIKFDSFLYSSFSLIVSCLFAAVPILIANQMRMITYADEKGLLISKVFKTTFISWEEIMEFGRYRMRNYGATWCYYVRLSKKKKKVPVGYESWQNIDTLSNFIIRKAQKIKILL
jgi:hypothetical protein